ncbi:hypothetical protein AHAS_Ahas09G0176000 [Arachis hypogaea]|uniref:FAR1 domain-containing protein n=1 Tax=Arachis hypogaea TaxID=3818 RepID=A0A445BHY5_ARAHY|nr:hypothetical protein Ahy_A09g043294 [Arachis hypogaea]
MEFSSPEDGSNSTLINSNEGNEELSVGEVVIQEGSKLPDHSGISEEKIPVIGMCFDSLPLAQEFYANYAKKVGFVTKIRNTNFDKIQKKSKIPINQFIHCTRKGYRESRVKAATWAN